MDKNFAASDLVAKLGSRKVRDELGVSLGVLRYWRRAGIPAARFLEVQRLALEAGVGCPIEAFSFRDPQNKKRAP